MRRAFPSSSGAMTRATMRVSLNRAAVNGRRWDGTIDLPRVKRALQKGPWCRITRRDAVSSSSVQRARLLLFGAIGAFRVWARNAF
jgi:hypothetical protein